MKISDAEGQQGTMMGSKLAKETKSMPSCWTPSTHLANSSLDEDLPASVSTSDDWNKHPTAHNVGTAAKALIKLHEEGIVVRRRLLNRHCGQILPTVNELITRAVQCPQEAVHPSEMTKREKLQRQRKDELDAALSLIKLSGQSRTESKAALALLNLRRESAMVLDKERQRRAVKLRDRSEMRRKQKEREKASAYRKFHEQYPAVLGTTSRRDGTPSTQAWSQSRRLHRS